MELLQIILAFFISLAFILVIWTVKGYLLKPVSFGKGSKLTLLISADGSSENLEREVSSLHRLIEEGRLCADILIVDVGMNRETAELATHMCQRNPELSICTPEELSNILTRGTSNGAEG